MFWNVGKNQKSDRKEEEDGGLARLQENWFPESPNLFIVSTNRRYISVIRTYCVVPTEGIYFKSEPTM